MKECIEREAAIFDLEIYEKQAIKDEYALAIAGCCSHIRNIPAADVVEVVRCKDCKHRPTKPEKYDDGFDLAFPDEVCPCYCDNDPFYSRYPEDDWFCPRGERKGGGENEEPV